MAWLDYCRLRSGKIVKESGRSYLILRCATGYLKGLKAVLEVSESVDNFRPNN
jgi:hypothetical protein